MVNVFAAVLLAFVTQAASQGYDTHVPYVQAQVVPVTVTETITGTQTIRVPVTSDVWVSDIVTSPVYATQLVTEYSWVPVDSVTRTTLMTVTTTPVSMVSQTSYVNPTRTVVSVHTIFLTETARKDLYHTVTHVALHHEIETVPVSSVQTLVQRITTTTLSIRTVIVTSTTRGYH
ncbi:uncharacterized protein LOC126984277 [Eriocheir sinensis]|uniref:uncharacterized protein LOC126984277 n=1 Tax=Eriocheir sinensis TaxID=95602 RepID=UPI0021C8364A|nr:uncharacterized protein LOC126984277 [Eriocheir sinensis]